MKKGLISIVLSTVLLTGCSGLNQLIPELIRAKEVFNAEMAAYRATNNVSKNISYSELNTNNNYSLSDGNYKKTSE